MGGSSIVLYDVIPLFSFLFFCCLCLLVCLFNCEMSGESCAQEGPKPQLSFLWLAGVCWSPQDKTCVRQSACDPISCTPRTHKKRTEEEEEKKKTRRWEMKRIRDTRIGNTTTPRKKMYKNLLENERVCVCVLFAGERQTTPPKKKNTKQYKEMKLVAYNKPIVPLERLYRL